MSNVTRLVEALKRQLKARGITYAALAQKIGLSEPSVKRMFAARNFTLERLEQILAVLEMDFAELAQSAVDAPQLISELSWAQEKEIISDTKLLVVAVLALNQVPMEEVVARYKISAAEATACLLRLDKIGFLMLKPNNRVKLLVSRTFSWLPNGPIQSFFRDEAYGDYFDSRFDGHHEVQRLVSVMLSQQSTRALLERLKQVADEFSLQHQDDARLPYEERRAVTIMLAARPWMPKAFKALLRG
jgi:transcriptional regulator with XRE-family HTH domain